MLPYFKRSEDQEGGDRALHGTGGPLGVSDARISLPVIDAFVAGCGQAGIGTEGPGHDLNGRSVEGAGLCQTTTRDGWRCSTATAYLAQRPPNLRIETDCAVQRVVIETAPDGTKRAAGLEYSRGDGAEACVATASKEVIVSAGAVGSPHLLMLSGIGEAAQLEAAGVAVTHDLDAVGKNLQDHLQVRSVYRSRCPTLNDAVRSPLGLLRMAWEWATRRSGPLTMAPTPAIAFGRTRGADGQPAASRPDVQIHFGPWTAKSRQTGLLGMSPFRILDEYSAFTMTTCQLRPRSRGEVRLNPEAPQEAPLLLPRYLSEPEDLATAVRGLRLTRSVARSAALGSLIEEELSPRPELETDAELEEYVRATGESIYHPVGTCAMGSGEAAVVDPRLRVHGVEGLRVVDASVMPTIVSGNTNAATVMIAEKGADMILEDA